MSYPYINNTGALRDFLKKAKNREIGIPDKLSQSKLSALGFKSSGHRPIIPILKFINFIGSDGGPTSNFTLFRDSKKSGSIMAECIRKAYSELYQLYPDAHNKDNKTLEDFFSTKTTAKAQVIQYTVRTYKVLVEFADFESIISDAQIEETKKGMLDTVKQPIPISPFNITLNINIQIELPITEDVNVYDKIFDALRRNLIDRAEKRS